MRTAGLSISLHDGDGFFEGLDDVALVCRQRLHQNGDAALLGMRSDAGQAIDEIAASPLRGVRPPVVPRCLGEPNTITPSSPRSAQRSIRFADVMPASRAQRCVRGGDVQPFGRDHQPVQPDEAEALGMDRVAIFARAARR